MTVVIFSKKAKQNRKSAQYMCGGRNEEAKEIVNEVDAANKKGENND
jgi:hypothetical protein